jgi:FKBP-type peptidyl-prolyl cis-trans isomerase 2
LDQSKFKGESEYPEAISGNFINLGSVHTSMQKGDFVTINYVATVKDTNNVFDTTIEEVAKKEGIHTQNAVYGPVTIVLGARHVIPGLEKVLLAMESGEEKEVDIQPEEAFGVRRRSLVNTVPLREFRRHKILPRVGMRIEINNKWATVRNVSSGRVTLDFNHPLSGKVVHYTVQMLEKVEDTKKKIEAIMNLLGIKGEVVSEESTFFINLDVSRETEKKSRNLIKRRIERYIPEARISFS